MIKSFSAFLSSSAVVSDFLNFNFLLVTEKIKSDHINIIFVNERKSFRSTREKIDRYLRLRKKRGISSLALFSPWTTHPRRLLILKVKLIFHIKSACRKNCEVEKSTFNPHHILKVSLIYSNWPQKASYSKWPLNFAVKTKFARPLAIKNL